LFDLRAVSVDKTVAVSYPAELTITYKNGGYSLKQVLNVDKTFCIGRRCLSEHILVYLEE
jgi:hypothetical protein